MLPALTTSGIVSIVIAFLLGLLIGFLVKKIIQIGLILLAIVIILIAVGYITPQDVINFLHTLSARLPYVISSAENLKSIIPYTSLTFIIGFIIGIIKG
ncbi:hypothetical protein [Saccharolobus shibatae]|uniref:FUN14 family protein n=2 Tax=Saccharolobus shibatae TaxID=2286 RepID=A0A8F5C2J9_9CREN|nr:hypothetical protein [Saccharolobus shibatae]QXJ29513.1 hypothetical protein J5U23_02382 [Saccharolobus shibatae B12]QXJ32747.1 hypothetical protein J5U21_02398 [Saccharolobus shibatae]QXJ35876.1 hypothetical protein J5U22_02423 [Saccharolobus shibatae]